MQHFKGNTVIDCVNLGFEVLIFFDREMISHVCCDKFNAVIVIQCTRFRAQYCVRCEYIQFNVSVLVIERYNCHQATPHLGTDRKYYEVEIKNMLKKPSYHSNF